MKKHQLKKLAMALVVIMFGFQAFAQGRIELGAKGTTTPEAQNVSMTGFTASFSYNSIESEQVNTERGTFSVISMDNTIAAGNIGEPQVLVTHKLIAVPFGATPVVTVKNYTVHEYNLADFGIDRLYPQQASVSKSQNDVKFEYNEKAYTAKGFDNRPIAEVEVMGTMRGVQLGALQINAVRYDASRNIIRVYNDIDVEVTFENADLQLTEQTLVNTYSPYFRPVYATLFNERAIRDIYDEHPDLWAVPVKILVIANRMFETAMQPWLTWKTEKGFYMDVNYTDNIGTTASAIKQFIVNKYNEGLAAGQTPTWVMIVGDKDQVPQSQMGSATNKVTDLYYYAVAGGANDYYPDMFHSRFTCETVQEFQNAIAKSMMYEQYTMPDPSYLSNVLLIAGWDSSWNPRVGKPTIQYAMNYYYNTAHGYNNIYNFLQQPYTNSYASLNTGVQFVNYTAHGGDTSWSDPGFSVSDANSLTNTNKYFLAMGNCCLAANWGYSSKSLGEALLVGQNKGAYAYIGSPVETYWYEDYYFGVGATNTMNAMPTYEGSSTGVYDAQFRDDFNSVSAIPFIGNVAVCYAHANGYQSSSTATNQYYWEAYHVLGDGSVTPYHTNPIANTVSHMPTLPIGMNYYTVTADPGSYVGISKGGVLYGAGEIGEAGTIDLPITPVTSGGNAKIVVTHPQRQPYIAEVPCAAMTGPYIVVDSFTPTNYTSGEGQQMTVTFKNVGADATTGTTNVVLTCDNTNITIVDGTGSFGALAAGATTTLADEFTINVANGLPDNTHIQLNYTATNGSESWSGNMNITIGNPVIEFTQMQYSGGFTPGETQTVTAVFHNSGHYQATNAVVTATTTSQYATIANPTVNVGTIGVDENGEATFEVAIDETCPTTTAITINFELTADNEITATGEGIISNTCVVVFSLHDSYGDGWNGCKLVVDYSDSTPSEEMTISTGHDAEYIREISIGTIVTVSFVVGSYASETSFQIGYQDGDQIYASSGTPTAGQVCQFTVNCSNITYEITATANPDNAGTITGAGTYHEGSTCTLVAVPGSAFSFINWTRDGEEVSTDAIYSFFVTEDADFVANFGPFEGVVIGDGTDTDSELPSYNYYKYGLSQQIYTSEEIGMSGDITSVAFYNGGAEKTRTYDIYMVNTTKSSFTSTTDWITVTADDMVFSGEVTMAVDTWTTIYLTTPFEYDESYNLAIIVDDNTGSYTNSPHMACRVFGTNDNQAIYVRSDGTNYDPTAPTATGSLKQVKNQVRLEMEESVHTPTNLAVSATGWATWNGGGAALPTVTIPGEGFEEGFENGIPADWATIDADGDGFNWERSSVMMAGYSITPHTGNDMVSSQSYDSNGQTALTPDNYLVAPASFIPSGAQFSFWACAQDASYPAEHFGVAVSTSSQTDPATFTTIQEWTLTAKGGNNTTGLTRSGNRTTGNYYQFTADLSAYAGQSVYIAIRHFNCTDQFYLNVDDVVLSADKATRGFVMNHIILADANDNTIATIETANKYAQLPVDNLTSGNTYKFKVAAEYTDGTSEYAEINWNYTACDNYVGADDLIGYQTEMGNIISWENPSQATGDVLMFRDGELLGKLTGDMYVDAGVTDAHEYGIRVIHSGNAMSCMQIAEFGVMYHITVAANPTEGGTVTGGGYYAEGIEVTIVATAAENYEFINWTKDNEVVSDEETYTFTVTENAEYIANFEYFPPIIPTYNIVVSAEPADLGTVTGSGEYEEGDACTVTAEPIGSAYFVNWTENGQVVSTEMEYTFTVTADRTLVAHFAVDGVGENTALSVTLYPNPASEKVMIETSEFIRRCEVYNVNGALVFSKNECSESFEINVSEYAAGSYIVRLISDNAVETRRFTKE